MEKIKVLVADDHPAFREGLCRLLEDEADLEVVARTANGQETVSLAKGLKPDVAVIDVAMPGINGIEATKQIKEACPTTTILWSVPMTTSHMFLLLYGQAQRDIY